MAVLNQLKPEKVFSYFEAISQIPRGSGNTKAISDYLVNFAKEHQLKYHQDDANNVVIYKEASKGYEHAPVTILQGHCDMVCEKTPGSLHDFTKDPLDLHIDGDHIYAKDTTLGGDDGIAVAYALAILDDDTIAHPPLEVVITTDEEIGLLGAAAFDGSLLSGTKMINLDSEDEGHIVAGCAGGMTAKSLIPVEHIEQEGTLVAIHIAGLNGGHSGVDIKKNRANADILMGRFLFELADQVEYDLVNIEGGFKDNAIPRFCDATILVDNAHIDVVKAYAKQYEENIRAEYAGSDEGMTCQIEVGKAGSFSVFHPISRGKVIFYLMNIPCGIQKMSSQIEGLVESSTSLGIMETQSEGVAFASSTRSSVSSAKRAIGDKICFLTEFLGGEYEEEGTYPAWEYREDSPLRKSAVSCYEIMFGKTPTVEVIHAGLECGLFSEKTSQSLDCISIGPDMQNIHTTEETLSISSVQRTWEYLLELLKQIK